MSPDRGAPTDCPPLLTICGERDRAIPAWATRLSARLSGVRDREYLGIGDAGHFLFRDNLDLALPRITAWLDARLSA